MPFAARTGFFNQPTGGPPGPTLWTPADTDTKVWLDAFTADYLNLSGTNVTQWTNRANTAGKTNYTQGSMSLQPTWDAVNQCVVFDGVDDFLASTSTQDMLGNPDWCTIAVIEFITKVGVNDRFFQLGRGGTGTANGVAISGGTGTDNGGWSWRYNVGFEGFGAVTEGVQNVTSWTRPAGGNMAASQMWLDGTEKPRVDGGGTATINIIADPGGNSSTVGRGQGGGATSFYANIRIHELVTVEASDITTRQLLEGYAAWRWGLEGNLPAGHPYKLEAPQV